MGRISRYSLFVLFFLFLSGCANDLGPREKVSTFHFFVQFLDSEQMPKEGMPVSLSLKFQNQTLGVVSAKTISNGSSGLVIEIRYRNEPTFEFYATYVEDGLQKEQRFVYVITDKTEFKEVVIDPSRASKNRITSTNSSLLTP